MKDNYLDIIQSLHKKGIPYVMIGTYALKKHNPSTLSNYSITDCDIVIPFELKVIQKLIRILNDNNWYTTVWEKEIR